MSSATLATYLSGLATEHNWATVSRRLPAYVNGTGCTSNLV
ncbi:hypothetical protein [Spirosoma litoris]